MRKAIITAFVFGNAKLLGAVLRNLIHGCVKRENVMLEIEGEEIQCFRLENQLMRCIHEQRWIKFNIHWYKR